MTTAPPLTACRPRFVAIVVYTFRSCIPPQRWFGVLLPCVGVVAFGFLSLRSTTARSERSRTSRPRGSSASWCPSPRSSWATPCRRRGRAATFQFTWLSPTPVWQIVIGRWLGGTIVALVTVVPACALAAVAAGTPRAAPAALAAAAAVVTYVAIFVAIGCLTRRTAVVLARVRVPRRAAARDPRSRASPSSRRRGSHARSSSGSSTTSPTGSCGRGSPRAGLRSSGSRSCTAVALGVAIWRMAHMRLSGPSD